MRAAIIGANGFAELGTEEGRARQAELTAIARASGMRIVGPNTNGILNATDRLSLGYNTSHGDPLLPGPVSIAAHSGALFNSLAPRLRRYGVGFRNSCRSATKPISTCSTSSSSSSRTTPPGDRPHHRRTVRRPPAARARCSRPQCRQADRGLEARTLGRRRRRHDRAFEPARRQRARLCRAVARMRDRHGADDRGAGRRLRAAGRTQGAMR